MTIKPIAYFFGEHRFLSNFWPAPVWLDEICYASVEHAYQAAKTLDPEERKAIQYAATPGITKRLGKRLKIRPDWDNEKRVVMARLCWHKFQYRDLRAKLIATAPCELIEGNTWGDTFWGVCNGKGHNHLGRILMNIRRELIMQMQTQDERPRTEAELREEAGIHTSEDMALAIAQADAAWRGE